MGQLNTPSHELPKNGAGPSKAANSRVVGNTSTIFGGCRRRIVSGYAVIQAER